MGFYSGSKKSQADRGFLREIDGWLAKILYERVQSSAASFADRSGFFVWILLPVGLGGKPKAANGAGVVLLKTEFVARWRGREGSKFHSRAVSSDSPSITFFCAVSGWLAISET